MHYHIESGADITIAVQPVSADLAPALGILKCTPGGQIVRFAEKPSAGALSDLASLPDPAKPFLASMGIYIFRTDLLFDVLRSPGDDFGKDIIPNTIFDHRVMGYVHNGYWADIGTIRRFYEVNLEMAMPDRPFDFYLPAKPIYSRARFLPATLVSGARVENALIADGCRVAAECVHHSVIGQRSVIGSRARIQSSIVMGADYYESDADRIVNKALGRPDIGIGEGSVIECAIVDKNARIGKNVHIRHVIDRPDSETVNWVARDGLVVIPKDAMISDGTVV
jgi:glucose-1-phosphate adenylyltransferase